MPLISKSEQERCKLAQLAQTLKSYICEQSVLEKLLLEINDVNRKFLSDKAGKSYFIGGTLLHIASHHNHTKAFGTLLRHGADFTIRNKNGDTALHCLFHKMMPDSELQDTKGSLKNPLIKSLLTIHVVSANLKNPCSADGLSHFHIACASNHFDAVELFLNSGVSVNEIVKQNSSEFPGYTPLHFAVRFCAYETAKLLIEREANINAKDAKGLTPLHLVIERNLMLIVHKFYESENRNQEIEQLNNYLAENEKIIILFLNDNNVMNVDEVGFSKFHAACTLSDISLVEKFIKDVDINCPIHMDSPIRPGYTALHFAVRFNIEIVKLLLKNGANFAAKDRKEVTPFDLFKEIHGVEKLYDILSTIPPFQDILFSDNRTKLIDFIYATRSRSTLEEFFQSKPKDLYLSKNSPLWPGYCLSHLAVIFSKNNSFFIEFVKDVDFCPAEIYLECRGNTMTQDVNGRTPLHLAYYQEREKIIDLFFKHQLGLTDAIDIAGLSHLHIACKIQNEEAVRTLLSTGADVNRVFTGRTIISRFQSTCSGSTPLHNAVQPPNIEIIRMLVEHEADVNALDVEGMTPLHRFLHLSRHHFLSNQEVIKEICHLLLPTCDLKNIICSKNGFSHLHFASLTGNANAVKRLLKLGANPNAISMCNKNIDASECNQICYWGLTPLYLSLESRDFDTMNLLLHNGADLLQKKSNGMMLLYDTLCGTGFATIIDIDIYIKKAFALVFEKDMTFRERIKDDSGLTPLHAACFLCDDEQIQRLLTSRDDVNSQIHDDSPIWPRATPLHLLIGSKYGIEDLEHTMKQLLDYGANVTLTDDKGDTPLHQIWNKRDINSDSHLLRLLLSYQTDFSINPMNNEGITHFHLACATSEYTIVEKFLENGIDVNLSIDYHSDEMTFQTPLQFMLRSKNFDETNVESHLKTMDVLLRYGADINVQDENGSTPLLEIANYRPWSKLFFQKLHEAGVNMNCIDLRGYSVLETLMRPLRANTKEELQILFGYPHLFNSFNSVNGIGIISLIIDKEIFYQKLSILKDVMENPSLFFVTKLGRTPIHNVVANPKTSISVLEYAGYIERFIKMGFDIDAQDTTGKTALHLAAYFQNKAAIFGLLIAGADINITDIHNQTMLAELFEFSKRPDSFTFLAIRDKFQMKKKIARYIMTMQQCGLEVNCANLKWAKKVLSRSHLQRYRKKIWKELKDTKLVKIGTGSLTLRDFLTETGAVASRPSMMCDDREAVDKFFGYIDNERFPHLIYLFKLQYRKMLKRLPLMDAATHSVREILGCINGFSMPDICCRMILRFLSTKEIENLILSASKN